ncbi:MAG: hypothetical protein GTN80_05385 [Nitrososphaeria archaeon]|nr:hypothetical protein [Nitrososphaeria archaeon]NIQ33059.1 hypothetical protein [Nitrososphaeria archaeon]
MKFLILQQIDREVPIEMWTKLLPAQFKYYDDLEKEGKIEVSYHLIGRKGNLLIVNVDSDEELSSIIGEDPFFFHSKREVYPLTTRETHKKSLKKLLKRDEPLTGRQ